MNRQEYENRCRSSRHHSNSFSSVYPPGGLVAWPDGRTTRIGERRISHAFAGSAGKLRKGFAAWPVKAENSAQA